MLQFKQQEKRDMEKNYNKKEDIIKQLEELLGSESPADAYLKAKTIARKWRRSSEEEESFYEKELSDKFNSLMNELSLKAGDIAVNVEEKKNELIEKAKKILDSKNFKKGNEEMANLMEEWKQAGHLNKEKDDELWEKFREIRKEFFDKKNEYFAQLKETYAENKKLKEELIEKAKEILELENIKQAANKTAEIMDEWKKIGSAGRKDDESLWAAFLEFRKAFYKKRDDYYDDMKEVFAARTQEKKDLIAEAKVCLARSEFSEEEIEQVKQLRNRWKEVGNAGKANENKLWEEFNGIINKYYENMKFYK